MVQSMNSVIYSMIDDEIMEKFWASMERFWDSKYAEKLAHVSSEYLKSCVLLSLTSIYGFMRSLGLCNPMSKQEPSRAHTPHACTSAIATCIVANSFASMTCMHTSAVADLGFSEGGFCYSIVREMRVKNSQPRPLSVKSRLFSIVLERDFLLYLSINPFSIKIYAKAC